MDLKKRTITKALTWQSMGLILMTGLGYLTTGSLRSAGGLALGTFVIGTITYVFHERAWDKISWGRVDGQAK